MSAPASPPLSVWEQPGLDAGAKLAWLGLRSFANFGDDGDVFVWPSRAGLARRIGAKPEAVKKQVARLTKLGLVTRSTRRIDGADRDGWVVQAGEHRARGEAVPRVTQGPPPGATLPGPGEAVPQPRVPQAPHTLQDQSNYQSSEGDAPATPPPPAKRARPMATTGQPRSRNPHPTRETRHEQDTHTRSPEAEPRGRAAGEVADRDGSRAGDTRASAGQVRGDAGQAVPLNPHLDTTAQRHADLAAERRKPDNRADLSPELWALIAEHGYSPTAESKAWRGWMLGVIDDAGLELTEVEALLVAREACKRKPGTPRRDRLWSYKSAAWRDAIVGPMRKASEPEANPYGFTAEDLFEGATC